MVLKISEVLSFLIRDAKFSKSFKNRDKVVIRCSLLDKKISFHISGSEDPILVKSLKPPAEKLSNLF